MIRRERLKFFLRFMKSLHTTLFRNSIVFSLSVVVFFRVVEWVGAVALYFLAWWCLELLLFRFVCFW